MNDNQQTPTSLKNSNSPDWWSTLGLDYEEAFGNDPGIITAVHKWLSYVPPNSHVLDIGCGTGVPIARTVADAGHRYHGIDQASGMVDLCRAQVPDAESLEVIDMLYLATSTAQSLVSPSSSSTSKNKSRWWGSGQAG
ncbi:MAG: hypothetical protein Q9183_000812 [Haloplaca sp. 2 TL-2023]